MHSDDVLEEYLLTNEADRSGARIEALRFGLRRQFGSPLTEEAIRIVAGVEASFLQTAMNSIRENHGSVQAYARDVLGVTPTLKEHLIQKFIV